MAQQWEVVGGADKGGILVREGESIKSEATKDRLSTGALIEEIELKGERLHYKLLEGTGPAEGWVGLTVSGKVLVEMKEDISPPGEPGPVDVDEDFKKKVEAQSAAIDKAGDLLNYCPKYKVFGGPLEECKLRIICFHNAGGSETNFTGPGSPFFKWVKEKPQKVEVLAFDYPGRAKLLKSPFITNTKKLAETLLATVYKQLNDGIPYITWAHSVGTWVGFEFLMAARKCGCPMPKAAFFNAFPAPHMPSKERPWSKSANMNDTQLKKALKDWDEGHLGETGAGKVVFEEANWKTFGPQMRGDFPLFDEYKFTHSGAPKFEFPIHAWHFEKEYYNKAPMIEMWKDWTSGEFDHCEMKGMGHLTCFYKPDQKMEYLGKVTDLIKEHAKEYLA